MARAFVVTSDGADKLAQRLAGGRRAFREFLNVPTLIIVSFLALAALSTWMDRGQVGWLGPTRRFMQRHVFADANSTSQLLSTIAGSLITVTSITFSLLLLALQQSGSSMTSAVFDQFLRRLVNQFYFGFFVGLAIFTLIVLSS